MTVLLWSGRVGERADHVNDAFASFTGTAADGEAAIHGGDLARWRAALAEAQRAMTTTTSLRLRHVAGRYQWHRVEICVIGADARWVAMATASDVAATDAAAVTPLDDELISRIAHDLVAPLTTMLLWEGVLRGQIDDRMQAQAIDAIRQSALEQSRIVGELLDMSRVLKGTLQLERRAVRLDDIVDAALVDAHALARTQNVALMHRTSQATQVIGDRARLRQVLDTLLTSAIRLTAPGGAIALSVQRLRGSVEIVVTHATASSTQQHSGLAFATAQRLVAMHGGTLAPTSTAFVMSLPAFQSSPAITRHVSRDRAHRLLDKSKHRSRARSRM